MFAVVSHLDPVHDRLVRELWEKLDRQYRVRLVYEKPVAHISYLVFGGKPQAGLKKAMEDFVVRHEAFEVYASGLGVFLGNPTVLYVPVVRSAQLTCFHNAVWQELSSKFVGISGYYYPDRWIPHITLAHVNLYRSDFASILATIAEYRLDWKCSIDNLALIQAESGISGVEYRLPLMTSSEGAGRAEIL